MWLNAAAVPDVLWLPSSTRVKRTLVQGGVRIRQIALGSPIKKKNPESRMASGFFGFLTLAELGRATCGFEAVLEQNQTLYPLILLGFQALGFPVSPFVN
jgi:hypothetical protein